MDSGDVDFLARCDSSWAPPDTWTPFWMGMAEYVSTKSKDRSTKVGCVIVGPDQEVRALGYNGFPRGIMDHIEARHARPAKYQWTEHAERNAIYNAARVGVSLKGCTAYLQWFPCVDCARGLIQSGVTRVVHKPYDIGDPKWGKDFHTSAEMLREAGVQCTEVK